MTPSMQATESVQGDRTAAIVAGATFILATAAALASAPLLPSLSGADYLAGIDTNANRMVAGVALLLVAALSSAGIAVAMHPVMKRWGASLALASVVFRAMEGVLYIVAATFLLSLLSLSHQFVLAGADRATLEAIGDTLRSGREHAGLVAVICFCLGAFSYYVLFFQSRLVPRWLSGFGILAIVMMFVACILALLSDSPITGYVFLLFPILVQEMVLAVWLILRGFNTAPPKATAF
ncbi:MAG TPA: DUF4386 domain-containing protein [Devosia sp.]|nr:DUF4386 domain-containing protein [Devosia sp.]